MGLMEDDLTGIPFAAEKDGGTFLGGGFGGRGHDASGRY
jgi:hypothetical protein